MPFRFSRWLGRLSVGRKLALIYLLDLSAVIYVSGILIHEKYLAIDFAQKEIVGAQYTEAVRQNLMDAFLQTPDTGAAEPPSRPILENARIQYDERLGTNLASTRFIEVLDDPNVAQRKLLSTARELLTAVGNQSNLILDPDLDSYYVMSLAVLRFPEFFQVVHDAHDFMQRWGRYAPGENQVAQLLTLVGRLNAVIIGLESDYDQAQAAGSAQLTAALKGTRDVLNVQARAFQTVLEEVASQPPAPAQKCDWMRQHAPPWTQSTQPGKWPRAN